MFFQNILVGTWKDFVTDLAGFGTYSLKGCPPLLVPSPVPLYSPDDYSKLQLDCFQTIHNSVREKLKDFTGRDASQTALSG